MPDYMHSNKTWFKVISLTVILFFTASFLPSMPLVYAADQPSPQALKQLQQLIGSYDGSTASKNALLREWNNLAWVEKNPGKTSVKIPSKVTSDVYNHRAQIIKNSKAKTATWLRNNGFGKDQIWAIENTGSWLDPKTPPSFAKDAEFTWRGTADGTQTAHNKFMEFYLNDAGAPPGSKNLPGDMLSWPNPSKPHPDQYTGGAKKWVDVYNSSRPGSAEIIGEGGTIYSNAHYDAGMGLYDEYPKFTASDAPDLASKQLADWNKLYSQEMDAAAKVKKGSKHVLRSDKARRVVIKDLNAVEPRAVREAYLINRQGMSVKEALAERIQMLMDNLGLSEEEALAKALELHLKEADALIKGNAQYVKNVQKLHRGTRPPADPPPTGPKATRRHPREAMSNKKPVKPQRRLPEFKPERIESPEVKKLYAEILKEKVKPLKNLKGKEWTGIIDVTPDEITEQVLKKFNYDLVVNKYPELLDVPEKRLPVLKRVVREMIKEQVNHANQVRYKMWNKLPETDRQNIIKTRAFWDKHKAIRGPEIDALMTKVLILEILTDLAVTWYDEGPEAAAYQFGFTVGIFAFFGVIGKAAAFFWPEGIIVTGLAKLHGAMPYFLPVMLFHIAHNTVYLVGTWGLDVLEDDLVSKMYTNPEAYKYYSGEIDYWAFLNKTYLKKKGINKTANRNNLIDIFPEQDDLVHSIYTYKAWFYSKRPVFGDFITKQPDFWLKIEQAALKDWETGFNRFKDKVKEELMIEIGDDRAKLAQFEAYCLRLITAGNVRDMWPRGLIINAEVSPEEPAPGSSVTLTTKYAVFGLPQLDVETEIKHQLAGSGWSSEVFTETQKPDFGTDTTVKIVTFENNVRIPEANQLSGTKTLYLNSLILTKPGEKQDYFSITVKLDIEESEEVEEEEDPCEKAGKELVNTKAAAQSAEQALAATQKAARTAAEASGKVDAVEKEIAGLESQLASIKQKCTDAAQLLSEITSAQSGTYTSLMNMAPCYNSAKIKRTEACEGATELRNIRKKNMTREQIRALETKVKAAAAASQKAGSECSKKSKTISGKLATSVTKNNDIKTLKRKVESFAASVTGALNRTGGLEGIVTDALTAANSVQGKPAEADGHALTAESSRDTITTILEGCEDEVQSKSIQEQANAAAASARTSATAATTAAQEALTNANKAKTTLASLTKKAAKLSKKDAVCQITSGDESLKDIRANKDTSDIFAESASENAKIANECARFVSVVSGTRDCGSNEDWDEDKKKCVCNDGYEKISGKCVRECRSDETRDASGNCVLDPRAEVECTPETGCEDPKEICVNYKCISRATHEAGTQRVKQQQEERPPPGPKSGATGGGQPVPQTPEGGDTTEEEEPPQPPSPPYTGETFGEGEEEHVGNVLTGGGGRGGTRGGRPGPVKPPVRPPAPKLKYYIIKKEASGIWHWKNYKCSETIYELVSVSNGDINKEVEKIRTAWNTSNQKCKDKGCNRGATFARFWRPQTWSVSIDKGPLDKRPEKPKKKSACTGEMTN